MKKKFHSNELRSVLGLGIIFFLRMLGIFMILPVMNIYGAALKGSNTFLLGVAVGIYGLTQGIFQIPFGLLSDRIGRKPVIFIGLLLLISGSVLSAMTESIWFLILGRALQGSGAITSALMALLADLICEKNRTKSMAFIGISFNIAFAISMILGPDIANAFGLKTIFWLIAFMSILCILVLFFVVPTPSLKIEHEIHIVTKNIKKSLKNINLLKCYISIFFLHILLISFFIIIPKSLSKSGVDIVEQWKIYSSSMLIAFLSIIPLVLYLEKKIKKLFFICVLLIFISEIIFFNIQNSNNQFWILILGIQLFFISFNYIEAMLPSFISQVSPYGCKGTVMGIYSTSQFFGIAIGGITGGWLYKDKNILIMNILISLIWLIISFFIKNKKNFN